MTDEEGQESDAAPVSPEIIEDLDLDEGIEPDASAARGRESLAGLLGGGRAAIEGSIPPVAFIVAWLVGGADGTHGILWGSIAAIVAGAGVAGWGLARGRTPRAVVIGMLAVVVAAMIAYFTGEARNFFLVQLLSNAASALAWIASILVRWPFLGVIVGALVGSRTTWRRDPALLRAYSLASWVWVPQYVIRVVVFGALWAMDEVFWLGVMRVALTAPLIVACLVVSGWVLFRSIPPGHPGIRHPVVDAGDTSGRRGS